MLSTAGIETITCPVTGMPLRRSSDWTKMELDDGYQATLFLLGDRIIVGRPYGYFTMDGIRKILRISQGIIDEYLDPDRPYIHIQDYSHITGGDLKARKYFSDEMKKRLRTRAAIFCGQTPWGRIAFQLAVRLHNFPYDMLVAKDYPHAALRARQIIMEDVPPPSHAVHDQHKPARGRDWEYRGAGCSARFEIAEGSIVHSTLAGSFDEKDVGELGRLRNEVMATIDRELPVFFLEDLSGLQGVTREGRKAMQAQFFEVSAARKIGGLHIYGANSAIRAAVYLGRPFTGVNAALHDSYEEAMGALREERTRAAGTVPVPDDRGEVDEEKASLLARQHVEKVLAYLSAQNWDREGPAPRPDTGENDPFIPVYETIDLVKRDLDDLFREHRKTVEELQKVRDGLWERIAERTADLSAANDRLRKTDLQRSRLAADLNKNLGPIFAEISHAVAAFGEKGDGEDGPGARERVRTAIKEAENVVKQFCRDGLPGGAGAEGEHCDRPLRKSGDD